MALIYEILYYVPNERWITHRVKLRNSFVADDLKFTVENITLTAVFFQYTISFENLSVKTVASRLVEKKTLKNTDQYRFRDFLFRGSRNRLGLGQISRAGPVPLSDSNKYNNHASSRFLTRRGFNLGLVSFALKTKQLISYPFRPQHGFPDF